MKNLILFIFLSLPLSLPTHLLAETATEGMINQTLLNNAANTTSAPQVQIFGSGGSNSGANTSTGNANLSDQEKQLSENFVDQAGANKIIKEKCAGDMKEACSGYDVGGQGLMKAAAQAYASFGAMSDSFLPLSAGNGKWVGTDANRKANKEAEEAKKPEENADASKKPEGTDATKKEKPADYCKYIPAATEAISVFTQKNTVQNLNNGGETSQKEQLLKAAKSHDGRAEQAQIQTVGWYGGAACYAINMMAGNFATDKNAIIKLIAAAFLGTVYQKEVDANKGYAQKTRDIANSLPSKGNCNPVTENECYCSTPEYENDPTYCKVQIAKRNMPSTFTRVACTNSQMQIDAACACEKSNSCFEKFLENQGAASLQIGMGYGSSPFKSVVSLAHGRLEGGTLNGSAYAGTLAIAKKGINELISKIPGNNNPLTPNQKAIADAFAANGIPASASRLMAQNPPPSSAINSAMAKASSLSSNPPAYQLASFGKNNVLDFSGGNGLGISGRKNEKRGGVDDILGKMNAGKGAASSSKILEFAQKAQATASQITKSDRPIFEIISIRYQTSGRRLLQVDTNN